MSSALSASFLISTVFPLLAEPSAVSRTFASATSSREARACPPKPENIGMIIAPIFIAAKNPMTISIA